MMCTSNHYVMSLFFVFFFQAEDGIRDLTVTGVQTCALPIFSYAHRFLITGKWYFRAGVEYERFDFDGTNNGLPDHLQTVHALLALEYVVHDHAGAGIEIQPGPYFQDKITGNSIAIPWKVWVTFPLK